jgi:hypothetical protein
MWAEDPIRFPQLSLITRLRFWRYELMASPSFFMMLFHRRTEVQSTVKVLVGSCAGGYQVEDGARGLADAEGPHSCRRQPPTPEGPIHVEGHQTKAP